MVPREEPDRDTAGRQILRDLGYAAYHSHQPSAAAMV